MKIKLILAVTISILFSTFAQAEIKLVQWLGQFPQEQAGPVALAFNKKYADKLGFRVEYTYDDKRVTDLLNGLDDHGFDLVHMKDADSLNILGQKNLSAPLKLDDTKNWPLQYKDAQNRWVALLKRARIIYYNSELVKPSEIKNYEDLAAEKFKDKLCLRQKKAQYTAGLHSFFLGVYGEEKTTALLTNWGKNTENVPLLEKDLDHVIAKVESGECLVGIANTYYYARHLKAVPNAKAKPMLPNQDNIGAHVNIDGAALLQSSELKEEANLFAQWLLTEEAQLLLSDLTDKFPANPQVHSARLNAIFGQFKENRSFDLNRITDLKTKALISRPRLD